MCWLSIIAVIFKFCCLLASNPLEDRFLISMALSWLNQGSINKQSLQRPAPTDPYIGPSTYCKEPFCGFKVLYRQDLIGGNGSQGNVFLFSKHDKITMFTVVSFL